MAVKHSKNLKGYIDRVVKCADKGDKIYIDHGGIVFKPALVRRIRELIQKGVLAVDESDLQMMIKKEAWDKYRTGELTWGFVGYIKL